MTRCENNRVASAVVKLLIEIYLKSHVKESEAVMLIKCVREEGSWEHIHILAIKKCS